MDKSARAKLISVFLTVIVLAVLIFSGPASAVVLNVDATAKVRETNEATITAAVDIESAERIPVQWLSVEVASDDGSDTYACKFYPTGAKVTGECDSEFGTITVINNEGYTGSGALAGYGYGYETGGSVGTTTQTFTTGAGYGYTAGYATTNGELAYTIKWTTPRVSTDTDYHVRLTAYAENGADDYYYLTKNSDVATIVVENGGGSSSSDDDAFADDSTDDSTESTTTDDSTESSSDDSTSEASEEEAKVETVKDSVPKEYSEVEKKDEIVEEVKFTVEELKEEIERTLKEDVVDVAAKESLEELKAALESTEAKEVVVEKKLDVYKATNPDNGVSVYRSIVSLSFKADKPMKDVKIVESIPKDVAADVSELEFPGAKPRVLQADPIVEWTFDEVKAGEEKDLSYVVKKELKSIESTTFSGATVEEAAPVKPVTTTTETTTTETKPAEKPAVEKEDTETPEEPKSKTGLMIVLALVLVGVVVGFFMWKKKQDY